MLRRDLIHDVKALRRILAEESLRIVIDRALHDLIAGELFHLSLHLRFDLLAKGGIRRDEENSRTRVMLRLRQEVGCDPCRIRAGICHAAHLGWTCDHVDADRPEDETFRHSDEGIARSYDLEDRLDRLRAVCQHRDALRTTDLIDLLYASHVSSSQNIRIHLAILPWRCRHRDRRAASHKCRYRIHEYGRGICRAAARYIDADTLNGKKLFTELHTISEILRPGLSHLFLVECLDIRFRFFQNFQKFRRHLREGFLHLFFRHAKIRELYPVEFLRQLTDGIISPISDLFQNGRDGLLQLFR